MFCKPEHNITLTWKPPCDELIIGRLTHRAFPYQRGNDIS